jgi:hypothetical protein
MVKVVQVRFLLYDVLFFREDLLEKVFMPVFDNICHLIDVKSKFKGGIRA